MLAWTLASAVGVPALLMGFAFPLANAHAQRVSEAVGAQVGRLYLATAMGNALGAAMTGLLWLPQLGVQASAVLLGGVAAAAIAPMFVSARSAPGRSESMRGLGGGLLTGVVLGAAGITGFALLPRGYLLRDLVHERNGDRLVAISEGAEETIAVVEWGGTRTRMTNGHAMSGTSRPAQRYMRAFAHVPLLQLDHPGPALVICFGVGNTAHAASLHPVERLEVADFARNVLEHASDFARWNHDVLRDPRVQTFIDDGRHHLRMQPEGTYDLITLEPPPIAQAGVSALYSEDFYRLARSRLRRGGFLTQWLPAYQVQPMVAKSMIRAFVDVFPDSVLLSGDGSELMLMGRAGVPIALDLDAVERNLRARPEAAADLARIGLGRTSEIAGTFVASADALRRATDGVAPMTDDRPTLEYNQVTLLTTNRLAVPSALEGLKGGCPACYGEDGKPNARVPGLEAYLAALGAYYASESFQAFSNAPDAPALPALAAPPELRQAVTEHLYLRELFPQTGE